MKITVAGLIVSFCVASVFCQGNIVYRGFVNGQHYYSYDGQDYPVLLQHHEQFRTNPEAARQRFLTKIQEKFTSRFENVNADREASNVNIFRPNKKNPQAVIFPVSEPQGFNPSIPFQPSFVPRIPIQQNQNSQSNDPFDLPFDTGYNVDIPQRPTQDRGNRAITEFAWRLFKGSNSQSDFVLSPLSPQILLSYLTWVAEGRTRQELVLANGYGSPDSLQKTVNSLLSEGSKRELQIATAFFVSNDMRLNQQFFDRSKDRVDIVNVDFKNPEAAGRTISKWANKKTKNGLKLNEINLAPTTKIALTSAVYYKANWIYKFNPAQPGIFNSPNGPVQVPMMNMKRKFRWGKIGEFAEWAAIPYESEDSLIIILPNRRQSLDNVINFMDEKALVDILYEFDRDSTNADVNITLPKFKLESTTNLVEPLKRMGIQSLFSPRAELPYLSDYQSVQVSNAQQQASIDVNEEGTVVVSFTNINVVALSFSPPVPSVDFVVDRPFLAVVANRDRKIPFAIAKITNPTY